MSRIAIALTALALAGALPAVASADIASSDGTTVTVQGGDGNENIILSRTSSGMLAVNTDQAGPGCTANEFTQSVECPLGPGGVRVSMAGGDDRVTSLDLSEGSLPDGALSVDLGPGNDRFTGSNVAGETVAGGPGNDEIELRGGNNTADGGDGNDTLSSDGGRDVLHGGIGDDVLDGDRFAAPASDVIDGGPGSDKAEGWAIPDEDTHPPFTVTLNGAADDGRPGEGDDVRAIERFTSNVSGSITTSDAPDVIEMWANLDYGPSTIRTLGGNDVITAGSGNETIDAGAGDDRIDAGYGDDTIAGGAGRDSISADKASGNCGLFETCYLPVGNDVIDVRDGEDDSVSCGVGTDKVTADPADTIAPDCEQVTRAAGGGASAGRGATSGAKIRLAGSASLRAALRHGLKLKLSGVSAGKVSATARRGHTKVASGKGRAGKRGTATVTLRFTRKAKRSLAHVRRVTLTVSAAGVTGKVTLKR